MPRLSTEDEGKRVVNSDGERVGLISGVTGREAFVDPDPSLTERIRAKIGWDHVDKEDFLLDENLIAEISDSEVRLKE